MLNFKKKFRDNQLLAMFGALEHLELYEEIMEDIIEQEPLKKSYLPTHYVDLISKHPKFDVDNRIHTSKFLKVSVIIIYLKYNDRMRFINCGCGGTGKFAKKN